MKEKKDIRESVDRIVMWVSLGALVFYGIACIYLYYHQLFFVEGGAFESDLPFHVSMAVEDHWFYSLTAFGYLLFYMTPWGEILTALFLAAVSVATVVATFYFLRQITEKRYGSGFLLVLAVCGNFIMPFYVEAAHFQRYIGYQSASVWHNSTYICMKLAAILTLSVFLKLTKKYRDGLALGEWLGFALLLILCNSIKPSFFLIFAPAMLVYLIAELFRRVPFKRLFVFGAAVLPSVAVVLWQNLVLFGDETGNGIELNPGYALFMRGTHPKVTFVLSVAFPLLVLSFSIKELKKDWLYRFTWVMWLFGFLEVFLFTETGGRAKDSNFFWSYSVAVFFVNLISMYRLLEKEKNMRERSVKKWIRLPLITAGVLCMFYQVGCGIFFFCQLLTGKSYWM